MPNHLFVLNLPDGFSESRMRAMLEGCSVTSIVLAEGLYGYLASIEMATQEDAVKAETILNSVAAPFGIVRGETRIGEKLAEMLIGLMEGTPRTHSELA